jgi:hypothetical protein
MRHTLLADLAAQGNARLKMTYETTDAAGELVLQSTELRGVAVIALTRGLDETQKTLRAWRKDPTCAHCGLPIATAKEAGMIEVASTTLVAHRKGACLARAIATYHPTVSRTIVHHRRAGE